MVVAIVVDFPAASRVLPAHSRYSASGMVAASDAGTWGVTRARQAKGYARSTAVAGAARFHIAQRAQHPPPTCARGMVVGHVACNPTAGTVLSGERRFASPMTAGGAAHSAAARMVRKHRWISASGT